VKEDSSHWQHGTCVLPSYASMHASSRLQQHYACGAPYTGATRGYAKAIQAALFISSTTATLQHHPKWRLKPTTYLSGLT
jgi:hypothetical protein